VYFIKCPTVLSALPIVGGAFWFPSYQLPTFILLTLHLFKCRFKKGGNQKLRTKVVLRAVKLCKSFLSLNSRRPKDKAIFHITLPFSDLEIFIKEIPTQSGLFSNNIGNFEPFSAPKFDFEFLTYGLKAKF